MSIENVTQPDENVTQPEGKEALSAVRQVVIRCGTGDKRDWRPPEVDPRLTWPVHKDG